MNPFELDKWRKSGARQDTINKAEAKQPRHGAIQRAIVQALWDRGELRVTELMEITGLSYVQTINAVRALRSKKRSGVELVRMETTPEGGRYGVYSYKPYIEEDDD